MAEFSKLTITRKGQALIAKVLTGGAADVDFTKIAASSAVYDEDALEDLTELAEIRQEAKVSRVSRTNDVAVQVESAFSNENLAVGYHMRTLGLYAVDPEDGEILYAATAEVSGHCYMPPYNGITVSGAFIQLVTTVGSSKNISLEVNPAAIATLANIREVMEKIDALAADIIAGEVTTPLTTHDGEPITTHDGEVILARRRLFTPEDAQRQSAALRAEIRQAVDASAASLSASAARQATTLRTEIRKAVDSSAETLTAQTDAKISAHNASTDSHPGFIMLH